jgi:hypothetical protein
MTNSDQPLLQFKSLDDIRARKDQLRMEIRKDSQTMRTQWDGLFHKEKSNLPSQRFANMMSTGAAVFDGILFAWKLYNRLHGKSQNTASTSVGLLASIFSGRNKKKRKRR